MDTSNATMASTDSTEPAIDQKNLQLLGPGPSGYEKLISMLFAKEEMREIPMFYRAKDINLHLKLVNEKFDLLNIQPTERMPLLMQTLHDDVKMEIKMEGYQANSGTYESLCKLLKKTYKRKKTPVSCFLSMTNIKQTPGQTVRDFLSVVRVEGYKLLSNEEPDKIETVLTSTFINGLSNKNFREALKQLKPSTLTEAYKMIKDEKIELHEEFVRKIVPVNREPERPKINSNFFEDKLNLLLKEINSLKSRIQFLEARNQPKIINSGVVREKRQNRDFYCYRCNELGHFAKECTNKPFCPKCKIVGHCLRDCFANTRNRPKNVRQLGYFEEDQVTNADTADFNDQLSNQNLVCNNNVTEDEVKYVNAISTNSKHHLSQAEQRKIAEYSKNQNNIFKKRAPKRYTAEVDAWYNYVNNNSRKPKPFTNSSLRYIPTKSCTGKTLISTSNSEPAANKPVVRCRIYETQCSVLFDTGAEINVIDGAFLRSLTDQYDFITVHKHHGKLNCANGTPLNVEGNVDITLTVGTTDIKANFTVVSSIFPRVIIGLKTMKQEDISVLPICDAIKIGGIEIPFISKTTIQGN